MALTPLTINSGAILQPSKLKEYKQYTQTEKVSIDDTMQRNRIATTNNPQGFKYIAELEWENVAVTDFTVLSNLFTSGSGVYYNNPGSKYGTLSFSGLPFPDDNSEYAPGESLVTSFKVRIRQI